MKFLENNIEGLKEFDKSPNKKFADKIKSEVRSLSKPLRFKNMWMDYNFKMPSNAKKGILYEINSLGNKGFAKKVEGVIVPILSKTIFSKAITDDYMCGNSDQTFFETKKKDRKVALSIPYIKQVNKAVKKEAEDYGYDPNDYGYEGAVLMSNYYKGKVKGIGEDATLYYFVLLMGCDMEDDIADPSVCVEVITPIDKGEDFFLNEVKNAVAKFNPLKFTGKAIKVNKCPKAITGSTEMKPYSYKGQVITASSKEEAIKKVVAFSANELDSDEIADKLFKESAIITHCGPNTKYIEILVMPKALGDKTYKCLLYCKIPSIVKVESAKKDTTKTLLSSSLIKSLEKELNKHLTESNVVNGRVTSFRIRGDKKYITIGFDSVETAEEREINKLAKELDDIVSSMI